MLVYLAPEKAVLYLKSGLNLKKTIISSENRCTHKVHHSFKAVKDHSGIE